MTTLASCKKLEEIRFSGPFFKAIPFGKNYNLVILTEDASVDKIIVSTIKGANFFFLKQDLTM